MSSSAASPYAARGSNPGLPGSNPGRVGLLYSRVRALPQFRDSIEEAVMALHEKIKTREIALTDGRFPTEAHALFRTHGAPNPHDFSGPVHECKESSDNERVTGSCYSSAFGYVPRDSSVSREYRLQECTLCSHCIAVSGSSKWCGTGTFAYLQGDTRDPPYRGAVPQRPVAPGASASE